MSIGNDQQVPGIVGKSVHDDKAVFPAPDDKVLLVIFPFRDLTKEASRRLFFILERLDVR